MCEHFQMLTLRAGTPEDSQEIYVTLPRPEGWERDRRKHSVVIFGIITVAVTTVQRGRSNQRDLGPDLRGPLQCSWRGEVSL